MRLLLFFSLLFSFTFDNSKKENNPSEVLSDSLVIMQALERAVIVKDSTNHFLKQAENLAHKNQHNKSIQQLGLTRYYILTGQIQTAEKIALKNLEPYFENGKTTNVTGNLLSLLGTIKAYKNEKENSVKHYEEALRVFDKTGNKQQSAGIHINLANIFFARLDYPSAHQHATKARNFLDRNDPLEAHASGILSVTLVKLDSLEKAKRLSTYTLEQSKKHNNPQLIALANYAIGECELKEGQYVKALEYYTTARSISESIKMSSLLPPILAAQLHCYVQLGDFENGIKTGNSALQLARLMENKEIEYSLYRNLSFSYKQKGDNAKAYEYLKTADKLFRENVMENNQKVIQEMLTKYETEKKEKQIAEQELKIQKQQSNLLLAILGGALLISTLGGAIFYNKRKQQAKLKQLQQEKENAILNSFILGEERERKRISHELHDSVAAMIGAAKMSLESIPHLPQDKRMEQLAKVERILERSHADIRHIAHNLLPTVLEKEGLIKATSHFISEINETKLVKISVTDKSSNTEEISPQLQLMLFRVIQELVNNIIKHSQAQNAEIIFSNSPTGLQIEISDDGIGYDDDNTTENQGLYSITQRLKSIGGNFKITKRKSGGTQAEVMVTV